MVNYKYKDRLFRKLFGEDKKNLLSLYNAVSGTQYTNEDDITINTIDDVVYMAMKNDVSCIFDSHMSLYEHQSTFNPNMPLRGMLYFARLFEKYITVNRKNLFGKSLIQLPTPQYYVFYNGADDAEDRVELHLSDAFRVESRAGTFEWTAIMLNINYGRNRELMEHCRVLKEYAIFNERIREFIKSGDSIEDAVPKAVDQCIQDDVLGDYLRAHKAEVIDVILTEYKEAETMDAIRAEGREEGRKEGRKEGREEGREEARAEDMALFAKALKALGHSMEDVRTILGDGFQGVKGVSDGSNS